MTDDAFHAPAATPASGFRSQVAMMLGRMARRIEESRSRAELAGLPDRMLRDMGLHRCDIPSVVRFDGRDATRRPR